MALCGIKQIRLFPLALCGYNAYNAYIHISREILNRILFLLVVPFALLLAAVFMQDEEDEEIDSVYS